MGSQLSTGGQGPSGSSVLVEAWSGSQSEELASFWPAPSP